MLVHYFSQGQAIEIHTAPPHLVEVICSQSNFNVIKSEFQQPALCGQ